MAYLCALVNFSHQHCKARGWASRCVGCGGNLPIIAVPSTLQKVKQSRKFLKCIGQRLVKRPPIKSRGLALPLRCHSSPKKETGHRVTIRRLEICFLCLLKPFKLQQGMSLAFLASKYVRNMFAFILLAFLTLFKPHNS
jgi:hypothetical protein